MGLIDVEVSRHDWSALRCGCGKTAEHLAGDLLRLAAAQSRDRHMEAAGWTAPMLGEDTLDAVVDQYMLEESMDPEESDD
ncbi:hypothetical protein [Streptomyces canus]|uniref:hypothetical protein n=1 Tax=Streptomyces canus TaxID=58343 RepID=UPI002E2DAD95|nr:hypothetical protein [Streptomyces canus]